MKNNVEGYGSGQMPGERRSGFAITTFKASHATKKIKIVISDTATKICLHSKIICCYGGTTEL